VTPGSRRRARVERASEIVPSGEQPANQKRRSFLAAPPAAQKTTLADSARFLSQCSGIPALSARRALRAALAKTMASYVDLARGGRSSNLVPAPAVTKALLARGIRRIVCCCRVRDEILPHAGERYPGVKIVQGDAYGLKATLAGHVNGEVATSSPACRC